MHNPLRRPAGILVLLLGLLGPLVLTGCATLQEVTALSRVDFSLLRVTDGTLAGIPIQSARSFEEFSAVSLARFTVALRDGELPLEGVLEIRAANPEENPRARLLGLDWTLFLDDRETVSGSLDEEHVLPSGQAEIIPMRVEVDLLDFFDDQLEQVVGLALAVAGAGEPQRVYLEATPTVQTPIGPVRYPEPIRIEPFGGG